MWYQRHFSTFATDIHNIIHIGRIIHSMALVYAATLSLDQLLRVHSRESDDATEVRCGTTDGGGSVAGT